MNKPAIFIDAFISDDEKKKWFDYNVSNFIKENFDLFIISNKIPSFDKFENIKYFEYDSKNRVITDMSKYKLCSNINWWFELYDDYGTYYLSGDSKIHGFTNWTILYNIKRICKVLKSYGYEYMIRCEYDTTFKNYDLMNNVFKDFGTTEKSKTCMIIPASFGCTTNFFLINVNYIDSIIPDLETEDDYIKFINKFYGYNLSPVFEELFFNIIKNDCEYLNKEKTYEYIDNISACASSDDSIHRHKIVYKNLFVTPVNNTSEIFFFNTSKNNKSVYVKYTTYDDSDNLITENVVIESTRWVKFKCFKSIEIITADMPEGRSIKFDLIKESCAFTLTKHN